ncbi:MAG: Ig domain-containing protein, partial [Candidatus Thermoplasmatota archaeon]|nr:Ig domain-containing protein [Candidatus Thermoplasmatota archaeon]
IKVADNDPPVIQSIVPETIGTGESLELEFVVDDNIGISEVVLEYTLPGMEGSVMVLEGSGNSFRSVISIPSDRIGDLMYVLEASDGSGNAASLSGSVTIVDVIPPEIDPIFDLSVLVGESFKVDAIARDNIGIVSYAWSGVSIPSTNGTLSGSISAPGRYTVTVTVHDAEGNSNSTSFTIAVSDVPGNDLNGTEENEPFPILAIIIPVAILLLVLVVVAIIFIRRSRSRNQEDMKAEE